MRSRSQGDKPFFQYWDPRWLCLASTVSSSGDGRNRSLRPWTGDSCLIVDIESRPDKGAGNMFCHALSSSAWRFSTMISAYACERTQCRRTSPRPNGTSMDAPGDASISSNGTEHAVRCCRLSGLIKCGGSVAAGPVWKYADRVQIGYASLKALRSDAGFPDPVSLTFALTCPPTCPHPRRLPALRRSLRWWREPGSSPSSSSAPRRCAPSCWPAPPRRASSACAPASRPARGPSSRRAEPPSGRQSSRP